MHINFNFTLNLFGMIQSIIDPTVEPTMCKSTPTFDLMSSKTSYELYANIEGDDDFEMPGCEPIGIWHLSRHGARYPDLEDIERINEIIPKLRDNILSRSNKWICEEDRDRLQKWTSKMKPILEYNLTPKGELQQKNLGKRMKDRLPELMSKIQYQIQVDVKATYRIRAQQSANQYLNGFLDFLPDKPNITVENGDKDYLLKVPDVCDKYLNMVKKNKTACQELDQFESESFDYRNTLNTFKKRINSSLTENNEELFELALKVCQYEFLIDSTKSVWCQFFDDEMFKTLSYKEDIKYNCKYGYRYDINSLMTCDLNKNLVESLERIKNGDLRKAFLLFGHSSTILPFYSTLEIAKNEDDFDLDMILHENEQREYRISDLDPMNSNIAFIVYKSFFAAASGDKFPKYYLRVFRNEKLIKIKACGYEKNCDLEVFLKYFKDLIKSCESSEAVCKV